MTKRIIIADDDLATIRALSRCLTSAGYTVNAAQNGLEALNLVRHYRPALVMADWTMPTMDGLELCRAIRTDCSLGFVYFVMLTGRCDKGDVVQALDAGADDHVAKPFDCEELLAHLRAGERIVRLEKESAERSRLRFERDSLREAIGAMEQVLGVVGHELRTPLSALRTMSEFIQDERARNTPEFGRYLNALHDEVVHMSDTVDNLLEAARINSGQAHWNWGTLVLADVCTDALRMIRTQVPKHGPRLTFAGSEERSRISGDEHAIRRLVINLLCNAIKHTPQGEIIVCAATSPSADGHQWAELSVRDTGDGLEPSILKRLGDPFALNSGVIGDRYVRGTGLGLAICKGIVAAHGGILHIKSQRNKGTVVTARFRTDLSGPVNGQSENVSSLHVSIGEAP